MSCKSCPTNLRVSCGFQSLHLNCILTRQKSHSVQPLHTSTQGALSTKNDVSTSKQNHPNTPISILHYPVCGPDCLRQQLTSYIFCIICNHRISLSTKIFSTRFVYLDVILFIIYYYLLHIVCRLFIYIYINPVFLGC